MSILQMQAQLLELSNEYKRIGLLPAHIAGLRSSIKSMVAHLNLLDSNLADQQAKFTELLPASEDNIDASMLE